MVGLGRVKDEVAPGACPSSREKLSRDIELDCEVNMGCGADLMSDVLAFTHAGTLLLTGLTNPQVVRTAEMAEISAIVFVRGKHPPPETIELAEEKGIPLLYSPYTMFEVCGRLYQAGMPGCGAYLRVGGGPQLEQ